MARRFVVDEETLDWLLAGDPAVAWQAQRDLIDIPELGWRETRARVSTEGWGHRLLEHQDPDAGWGGGLYGPKWTSTTYTLLLLRRLGLDPGSTQAVAGVRRLLNRATWIDGGVSYHVGRPLAEKCINGMVLSIASYFEVDDPRVDDIASYLIAGRLDDGAWNCRDYERGVHHSSFHTTISALEGLLLWKRRRDSNGADAAMDSGAEFMLDHHMFRSHTTGEVINEAWTKFAFPPRWHYDVLRGLDHLRNVNWHETRGRRRRWVCCTSGAGGTVVGRLGPGIPVRSSSTWNKDVSPVGGTRSERSELCAGGKADWRYPPHDSQAKYHSEVLPLRDINPTRSTAFITLGLIAACLYVFFFIQSRDTPSGQEEFLYRRAAISCEIVTGDPLSETEIIDATCSSGPGQPVFPEKEPLFSVLTSLFLHGSVGHVLFNMWFLWIFGNNVEEAFGRTRYLLLYLLGGIAATGAFVVMNPDSTVPLVGASGAIAAVLGAYAVLFPGHRVLSLVGWFVIPVPAAIFLGVWFIAQFGLGGTNVAWEAHAGGFVFGFLGALLLRRSLLRRLG